MNLKFDGKLLAKDILAKRVKDDVSFRDVTKSMRGKLTRATIYRLEAAQAIPGADTLAMLCNWLEKPVQTYFK